MAQSALIPVTTGTIGARTALVCNARDLHKFLEVGRDFSTWICKRIAEYGFVEDEDFSAITAPPIGGAGNRGARTEYHITLDMAKELGMVERTEQGRAIRRYFIALEAEKLAASKKPAIAAPAPRQLALHMPSQHLSAEAQAVINRRAFEIIGSALPGVQQWLTEQARPCIKPDGTPAANFMPTLASADFAAYSTQWASKHLGTLTQLIQFINTESADMLTKVQAERLRLAKLGSKDAAS